MRRCRASVQEETTNLLPQVTSRASLIKEAKHSSTILILHILNDMAAWAFLFMIIDLEASNFIPHAVRPLTVTVIHMLSQILDLGFKAIILILKGQISGISLGGKKKKN